MELSVALGHLVYSDKYSFWHTRLQFPPVTTYLPPCDVCMYTLEASKTATISIHNNTIFISVTHNIIRFYSHLLLLLLLLLLSFLFTGKWYIDNAWYFYDIVITLSMMVMVMMMMIIIMMMMIIIVIIIIIIIAV